MFYILYPSKSAENIVYGNVGGEHRLTPTWEVNNCRKCRRPISTKQINSLPIELFGEELQSFVWTDEGPLFLDSIVQSINKSNLKGFSFRQVEIVVWWKVDESVNRIGNALEWENGPILHQVIPLGVGGSVLNHTRVKVSIPCKVCKIEEYTLQQRGIIIDETQWDGSDLFTVKEFPSLLVITDRFVHWLHNNKVENYKAIPAVNFSFREQAYI